MASKNTPAAAAAAEVVTPEADEPKTENLTGATGVEAPKSAADLLIEMQLEKELRASVNPLAVVEVETPKGEKNDSGADVVSRVTFANGAVLENYA